MALFIGLCVITVLIVLGLFFGGIHLALSLGGITAADEETLE